ncbi:hypothetical protein PN545_001017 [Cronobacter sakazakii]|nr:hypothetical protein [Cronobacter sakazakii]
MSEISKERAQEIFLGNGPELTAQEERALARIALDWLALRERAEPVYQLWSSGINQWIECDSARYDAHAQIPAQRRVLYTAPPAQPVAVPDETFDEWSRRCEIQLTLCRPEFREVAEISWNACRAAMLAVPPAPVVKPLELPDVSAAKYYTEDGAFKAFDYKRDLNSAMLAAPGHDYKAIVERIAEILHGKVTDIDLLTVTVQAMKERNSKLERQREAQPERGFRYDKVEPYKVHGLPTVRECSKHPGTELLVHPMERTASIPSHPVYYCPECEPKVFEWSERNNPFKPGGDK